MYLTSCFWTSFFCSTPTKPVCYSVNMNINTYALISDNINLLKSFCKIAIQSRLLTVSKQLAYKDMPVISYKNLFRKTRLITKLNFLNQKYENTTIFGPTPGNFIKSSAVLGISPLYSSLHILATCFKYLKRNIIILFFH
jgi:hypothetical protein